MKKLTMVDFDALFMTDGDVKVIPSNSLLKKDEVEQYISASFPKDANLSFFASCECGKFEGNFYIGFKCPECKKVVTSRFADELKFRAWIEIPDFIAPILHPGAYRILRKSLGSYKNTDSKMIDILMHPDGELPPEFQDRIQCGMTSFYKNFDEIIKIVTSEHKPIKKRNHDKLFQFLDMYKDILFIRHFPILNQHLTTSEGAMTYIDESLPFMFDTITELNNVTYAYNVNPDNVHKRESYFFDMYKNYLGYVSSIIQTKIARKGGLIRKCLLGTRLFNTFRGVITPIVTDHYADELHVPWRTGVALLKSEILNLLESRHGMNVDQRQRVYNQALRKYNKLVDDIMRTLISECPYKGLPVLFGRNPCLNHGSIQLLYITVIKTDLYDNSIGFSPLIVSAPNADFDGVCIHSPGYTVTYSCNSSNCLGQLRVA